MAAKILELPEPVAKGIWRQVSYTTYGGVGEQPAESSLLYEVAEMNLLLKKQTRSKGPKYQQMIRESAELRFEDFGDSDFEDEAVPVKEGSGQQPTESELSQLR